MSRTQDPAVIQSHILACALNVGQKTLINRVLMKQFPEPDRRGFGNAKQWKLSTIRAHDPALADRCLKIMAVVESPAQAA